MLRVFGPDRTRQSPARRVRSLALCLYLALLAALLAPAATHAEHGVNIALFTDTTGRMGLSEVRNQRFEPILSTFGGTFTTSVYWLRITVDASVKTPLELQFRPLATDRIDFFTPQPDGDWRLAQGGELLPINGEPIANISWYAFHLDPADTGPWYARIETRSPGAVTVTTVPEEQVMQSALRTAAIIAANMALLLFAAAVLLVSTTNPLGSLPKFGYLLMVLSLGAYIYFVNGFGRILLEVAPEKAEAVQQFLASFCVLTFATFHHTFLRDFRPARWARFLSLGLVIFSAFGPVASLLGHGQLSLKFALASYIILLPALLALLSTLRGDGPFPLRHLRLAYAAYITFLGLNIIARLGLIEAELLYRHSIEGLAIVTSTLLLTLIWLQERSARKTATERELALRSVSIGNEVDYRFQTARLALVNRMDAEALRLAKAAATLSSGPPETLERIDRALSSIRRIIDRCRFAQDASENSWNLRFLPVQPAETLRAIAAKLGVADTGRLLLPEADGPPILTDPQFFELAAENLLANALRYGSTDQPVTVTLDREARRTVAGIRLDVTNATSQSDPLDPAKAFGKFYRGPSAREQAGTGLGMFIASEVAQALSGEIAVTVTPAPHGAVVRVTLWLPERP